MDSTLQGTNEDIPQASNLYLSVNTVCASVCNCAHMCVYMFILPVSDVRQVKKDTVIEEEKK